MGSKRLGVVVLLAFGATPPAALAGGWAVTTLDPVGRLTPGDRPVVGYTVRQHGQRPVTVAGTGIEIRVNGSPPRFFPGRRQGPAGHYVARIVVPTSGARWVARQGWFGPQDLGLVPLGRAWGRSAVAGQALFAAKGCVGCHIAPTIDGVSQGQGIGLGGLRSRVGSLSREGYIRQSIVAPGAYISPNGNQIGPFAMPALVLTDAEVDALVRYLVSDPG